MSKRPNKNIEMLKCFFKVMRNNEIETEKILPLMYAKSIYDIDYDFLLKQGINKLIIDVDNTLVPVESVEVPVKLKEKLKLLRAQGFTLCIVSNNSEERVLPIAQELELLDCYLAKAGKPMPIAFDKALEKVQGKKEEVAMIGDQMLTDVKGANEYGIYSILVDPVDNKYEIKTGTSRVLQNIIESHLSKKGITQMEKYYQTRR